MFDLEGAIQDWRLTFRPDSPIGYDGSQEVESHLRESIERLQGIGLSTREAFAVGVHRLGLTEELETEFAKNGPSGAWRTRLAWMLGGYLALTICGGGASAMTALAGAGLAYAGADSAMAGPITVTVLVASWAGLLTISYRFLRNHDGAKRRFTWKWAMMLGVALYTMSALAVYGQLAQQAIAGASWYGESATWLSCGGFVVRMAVYLACFVVLCKLSKPLAPVAE
ncbi:MAG: hypothetical protein AAF664_23745 [Planctomycetota bacterium]